MYTIFNYLAFNNIPGTFKHTNRGNITYGSVRETCCIRLPGTSLYYQVHLRILYQHLNYVKITALWQFGKDISPQARLT